MPAYKKDPLYAAVIAAIESNGWAVKRIAIDPDASLRLRMSRGNEKYIVRVYIWRATYGGFPRSADESRVQLTMPVVNGIRRIIGEPDGVTVILGYSEEACAFAAFDFSLRGNVDLPESNSVQFDSAILARATGGGYAHYLKKNGEQVVAFPPDMLTAYILSQYWLQHGTSSHSPNLHEVKAIQEILEDPDRVNDAPLDDLTEPRRRQVREFAANVRDERFRRIVGSAYSWCCAMCGMDFGLVEAAHIVPVADDGRDITANGLALCPLHHRAFDAGLVTISPHDYRIALNVLKLQELAAVRRGSGLDVLHSTLRNSPIRLPEHVGDRPSAMLVTLGNSIRGWPSLAGNEVEFIR